MNDSPHSSSNAASNRAKIRHGWRQRPWAVALILLAAFLIFRVFWGWEIDRRLRVRFDAIVARGEPIRIVDAVSKDPPPPDAENAAVFYQQAKQLLSTAVDSPSSGTVPYQSYPPYPPSWFKAADAAIAANAKVFPLVRQARALSKTYWGPAFSPASPNLPPGILDSRSLANLLRDAAIRHHVANEDDEAIELLRDIHALSVRVDHDGSMVEHLVGHSIDCLTAVDVQVIAPDLSIEADPDVAAQPASRPASTSAGTPARRASVVALINELLDDRPGNLARAMKYDRAFGIEAADQAIAGEWLLRPMFKADLAHVTDIRTRAIDAAGETEFSKAQRAFGNPRSRATNPTSALALIMGPARALKQRFEFEYFFSALDRPESAMATISLEMRMQISRRMAAVSLAMRLYRVDHDGAWPAALSELSPKYLASIPLDPFRLGGQALKYLIVRGGLPDGGDRRIIYSVGVDGVDDTAAGAPLPTLPSYDYSGGSDEVRDLTLWTPAGPTPPDPATAINPVSPAPAPPPDVDDDADAPPAATQPAE